jgi:hypothetical protein
MPSCGLRTQTISAGAKRAGARREEILQSTSRSPLPTQSERRTCRLLRCWLACLRVLPHLPAFPRSRAHTHFTHAYKTQTYANTSCVCVRVYVCVTVYVYLCV